MAPTLAFAQGVRAATALVATAAVEASLVDMLELAALPVCGAPAGAPRAEAGSAQQLPTSVAGTEVSTANNVVTLNLQSLDGRKASRFNFAGTGATTAQDAVATAYTVSLPAALAPGKRISTPPLLTVA